MDDARLATALGRGADGALAAVFDSYAPQLYDYCQTFLADPESAGDALHEAILVAASWAPALADPKQFVPWLYAITRNECLRKLRPVGRRLAFTIGERPRPVAPSRARTDPVLREVTDLVNRYQLGPVEVAQILGVSTRRARGLCERSAAVLSRDRRAGAAIGRQARPGLPPGLRERVLASAAMPSRVAYRGELAQPRSRNGFPAPLQHSGGHRQRTTVLKVAAVFLLLSGLVLAIAVPTLSRQSVLGLVQVTAPAQDDAVDDEPEVGDEPAAPIDSETPGSGQPVPGWEPASPSGRTGEVIGLGDKCVDVRSSSVALGTPIDLFPCNATAAQRWTVARDGSLRVFDRCLGVTGSVTGARAQLVECREDDRAQQWNPQLDGTLVHALSGQCLEVPGGRAENYTVLTLGKCSGQPHQLWRLPG